MATDVLTRFRARSVQATDVLTRFRARASIDLTVTAGTGRTLEPGDLVTLSAAASTLPDTWTWTQIDGAQVTLGGAGQTRTFTVPDTSEGTTLAFQITATKTGATPATDTITFQVYPHTMWRMVADNLVPVVLTMP